jgi:hypothetical protein
MSRFLLALRCFFAVLWRSRLPPLAAAQLLPLLEVGKTAPPVLPASEPPPAKVQVPAPAPVAKTEAEVPAAPPTPAPAAAPAQSAEVARPADAGASLASCHRGAVQLLGVLQREGRLLDFLMEEIDGYADAQIGAAVRDIHRGCRKALSEHMKVRAIRSEPDEAVVKIPEGYDPSQIRLVGRVTGRPPFEGTLRHHGWRTGEINLSDIPAGHDPSVICPAEVELGA